MIIDRRGFMCAGAAILFSALALADGFDDPPRSCYPETWYHFIDGNVTKEGVAADLDALKSAGVSGVQFFHGGGISTNVWPGVHERLDCLSAKWDDCVRFIADACHARGLAFKMQNCPGWSMSGGPWIRPEDAMRSLVWSTTFSKGGKTDLPLPREATDNPGRDWRELVTVAFPRPRGDGAMLAAKKVSEADEGRTLVWEAVATEPFCVRTLEMPSVRGMNHTRCYDPEVSVTLAAEECGAWRDVRTWEMPRSNWQDEQPLSLATPETTAKRFRVTVTCPAYAPEVPSVRLFGRAYPHSWESESANCLRELMHDAPCVNAKGAYVDPATIRLFPGGATVDLPAGDWTILRIGHVNLLYKNGPAPAEARGWECDKLAKKGIEQSFSNYVGRLTRKGGVLEGKLDGMILDSWECCSQTWTDGMDAIFRDRRGYGLETWWPALCGYVVGDRERTTRFYRDWRTNISDLLVQNFYGRMSELARENGFTVAFETASGDVFPGDILEYYKGADVPMCEYWRADEAGFGPKWLENPEFKPFRPTVSAARLYGKKRVDAEALTGGLSWNEDLRHFKVHVDRAFACGVTHHVFHTCTHNPQPKGLPPGPSFGDWQIGSPFVRGQSWWKLMPYFTKYLARCTWMLEKGESVSDVLVYLGDEQDHKPRECRALAPEGYAYDYLNPDGLVNLVSVKDGRWVTQAGLSYAVLYVHDNRRLRPETLAKLASAQQAGAEVVGLAGDTRTLADVLAARGVKPDVETTVGRVLWQHRREVGDDWYFLVPEEGRPATVRLRDVAGRTCEIWNPRTGEHTTLADGAVTVEESVFVVARAGGIKKEIQPPRARMVARPIEGEWTLTFAKGWGRDEPLHLATLVAWKDLPGDAESKHYAGTATYAIDFTWDRQGTMLETPNLEGVAEVRVNGKSAGAIWCMPKCLSLEGLLRHGKNHLEIEVTTPWFNRLVYDAGQPVVKRKTWTCGGPKADAPLKASGLLPPVRIR